MRNSATIAACLLIILFSSPSHAATAPPYDTIAVYLGAQASPVERAAAGLLMQRMAPIPVQIKTEPAPETASSTELRILLGIPEHHAQLSQALDSAHIQRPTKHDPGLEGFILQNTPGALLAAAFDDRGTVYAVGEILRHLVPSGSGVTCSVPDLRTAPAFEIRGTQYGQSGVAKTKAHVRSWTTEETLSKIADFALAGANTMTVGETITETDPVWQFLKSLGMKTLVHYGPNVGEGPPEWQGKESIGRAGYLCPSVPEARQALLDKADTYFSKTPHFDYVSFTGGDGGGCECDRCDPYGKTFILLCEDMAAIVHKYHPDCQIFFTNQKFDNTDDQAIFQYLQEKPRTWLRAFCYGPGSDAMSWQPGHRQTHRMDLFQYPGFGPYSRYLHEILHQLPPQQDILFYNELTHWRYSQNGYVQAYPRADKNGDQPPPWNHFLYERMPDRFITQVYDRLTFYAWPRYYHWAFGETVRYGIGDVTHSSGTHDHFNQWMWQRLLWNPQQSVEQAVDAYARAWFGPDAAEPMAKAVFLMEQYLQEDPNRPLPQKDEVDQYYDLVKEAGARMQPSQLAKSWLWREYMQKAAIDKRTRLAAAQQLELQAEVETQIRAALAQDTDINAAIDIALGRLASLGETGDMRTLREEATRLGEESNTLYGVRSEGLFNLDHDFIGLGWTRRQLERAKADPENARDLLALIADYTNPGQGGYYDNCGTNESAPHLVNGYPYDFGQPYVPTMLDEANRPSQRTMCFTQDESQGVTFRYDSLDPNAQYRVRMTLVRPRYQDRYIERMNQHSESLYADDTLVARDIEIPERMSDHFTYDIPATATADGTLTLRLQKQPDVATGDRVTVEQWRNTGGWGTIISEIWLMKVNQ